LSVSNFSVCMKPFKFFFFLCFISASILSNAQTEISGTVKDAASSETLIGATVIYEAGKGATTDIDGHFKLNLPEGNYTLTVSYVGYTAITKKITVKNTPIKIDFNLELQGKLTEVEIVADVAKNRETPVAFSTIDNVKIQQELGSRDLPMLLNSTPGVYATETGGGSGDARVNVRGFDQRNVAVMIDGVPFNDMETGAVYWSNWNGLGSITRSMQIQRGLGASKLAIASVGGTINILTKGIDSKPGVYVKQTIGNDNLTQTSISYNSGNKNGVGVTANVMYSQGDGWVDETWSKSFSYFFKVQKRTKKHLISFGINGATQEHAQRPGSLAFGRPMYYYDEGFSKKQGINTDSIYKASPYIHPLGIRHNYNWGYYFDATGKKHTVSENTNYYHKPVASISDFWTLGDKLIVSNTAYLSVGKGGGSTMQNIPTDVLPDGQENYQPKYDANISYVSGAYGTPEHLSTTYVKSSVNNHFWYGLLSVWNYKINKKLSLQAGLDGRSYNGFHYQTPTNLMGGDYVLDAGDKLQPSESVYQVKRLGDKVTYNYEGMIRWAGLFAQLERKTEKFSIFLNATGNYSFYKRVDFFAKKDLILSDTTIRLALGYYDTYTRNGVTYDVNSPEAKTARTPWAKFLTYTLKTGMNYNLTEHHSVFMNVGYLVLPPKFVNVYDRNNRLFSDVKNQIVKAIEMGYGIKYGKFAANVNAYYTIWENKPPDTSPSISKYDPTTGTSVVLYYNINGMNALHKGVEIDGNFKALKNLTLEGVISLGDWRYTSSKFYTIVDQNGTPAIDPVSGEPYPQGSFDAKGVHVGNAAQTQYMAAIKYSFFQHSYFKARYTYFAKNYSNFDPTTLTGANAGRDSWKMPDYGTLDFFAGNDIELIEHRKLSFNIGVINALNTLFISDAQNNSTSILVNGGFNAYSSNVYFGQGRRWTASVQFSF
jgi:iron complex outermembrane receptor protein